VLLLPKEIRNEALVPHVVLIFVVEGNDSIHVEVLPSAPAAS
jgi:hypothetical protein